MELYEAIPIEINTPTVKDLDASILQRECSFQMDLLI